MLKLAYEYMKLAFGRLFIVNCFLGRPKRSKR